MSARTTASRDSAIPLILFQTVRQGGRLLVILLVATLVVVGTAALVQSPLGAPIQSAMAPQRGAGREAPPTRPGGETAGVRPAERQGGGRNAPSIQRGYPEVLRYGALMAGVTLVSVVILRVRRPKARLTPRIMRRRRSAGSASQSGGAA